MDDGLLILPSAHRHGVEEADIVHAVRFEAWHVKQADDMVMIVGPDRTGTLIEVGVIEWHGLAAVAHAMRPARTKYLR